ncbi:MAG: hypothetical protein QOJ00_2655 [Actinomycetota bacterium]
MTERRPPEAPDWIEAPLPWERAGATAEPVAQQSTPATPWFRSGRVQLAAAIAALVVVGSVAGGALTAKLSDHSRAAAPPTTTPFRVPFPEAAPTPPAAQPPSGRAAADLPPGIVDIDTTSTLSGIRGAGTGMVVSPDGDILTNNHVVEGATRITVTVVETGARYAAAVVGVDPTDDVALLHLSGASDLAVIPLGSSSNVSIGDPVVAAGNALGQGGAPTVVTGNVRALNQTITVQDELDEGSHTLRGLIQTDAPLVPGDSGGPMFDAANKVVGINTAAARGFGRNASVGLAVPIDTAKDVVAKIRDGNETSTIHIGVRGFLGVRTSDVAAGGAGVVSVQPGSPAEKAGVATGDVITTVDGTVIRTASALTNLIHTHRPGDTVTLAWTRSDGTTHSAKVTLASGAAD